MTSRRPMTRSFSANGRTSSFDEDGNSNGRTERSSSYLSNVRPENSYSRYSHYRPTRSTLCTVMAQLTEDVQPSFETTLKSKAVSENCNVKFTCVVSGTPAPELKWYKDDTEMDRYCGLPKYEIRRNGKTHTLHIYNCTLDDAAIYQVSASNSKGIVSCSGVLEVGTMNEYKIHQRFFDKLKQKAEKKKKDLEVQTKMQDKENTPAAPERPPQSSPERPPRKRHMQPAQENLVVKKMDDGEQMEAVAEINGASVETTPVPSTESDQKTPSDPLAKKKIKISNGVDAGVSSAASSINNNGRSQVMGNGGENCYDGGKSLAQFLAETLQSQTAEDNQSSPQLEKKSNESTDSGTDREDRGRPWTEDQDMEKTRKEDVASQKVTEKEKSQEFLSSTVHSKHHSKAHKDHEQHNIQASISSVFHSVKDFLFGKSKKDSRDHKGSKEKDLDHDPVQPETPPSSRLRPQHTPEVQRPLVENTVPMDTSDTETLSDSTDKEQQLASVVMHKYKQEDSFPHKDLPTARKQPPELGEKLLEPEVKETEEPMEVEPQSSSLGQEASLVQPQVHSEVDDKFPQVDLFVEDLSAKPPITVRRDESVLSPNKAADELRLPHIVSTTTSQENSTVLQGLISETQSDDLDREPTKTEATLHQMEEAEERTDKEENNSVEDACGKEKDEVKMRDELDEVTSELTVVAAESVVEERTETCEIKTPDQELYPSAMSEEETEEKCVGEEESESSSTVQEMMVELGPSAESSEKISLNNEHESTEETVKVQNLSAELSSSSGQGVGVVRSDVEIERSSPSEESSQVEASCKGEEQTVLEGEKKEEKKEDPQAERETERKEEEEEEIEMLEETEIPPVMSVRLNEPSSEVSIEPGQSAQQDNSQMQLLWPSEKIPLIQISIVDDSMNLSTPQPNHEEGFVIPKIEILEPELKECGVVESEIPKSEAEHDQTDPSSKFIMEEKNVCDPPGLAPTDTGMQREDNLSPTKVVTDPKQEEMMQDQAESQGKSMQIPRMEYTSLPVINVSCSDDNNTTLLLNEHSQVSPALTLQAPTVPLFVVPPISVTCHESEPTPQMPTKPEWAETETGLGFIPRENKQEVGVSATVKPEKGSGRNGEEVAQKSTKEDLLTETSKVQMLPKVSDNPVPSFNKTSEDIVVVPEMTMRTKPLKDPKSEMFVSVEDLQRNRSSGDRLSSKPPAHPSLSPASLRRFMSKTPSDLDNDTVSGDKGDAENLSGGSTPTSSLSCENSPRMKRRDSLTLIRSATPEELASGARRKIFIPKAKDDGDGAMDAQGKKDNPYMSPSQARRASLLQASKGPNTPPLERRSPLLNRRKATLEVPKPTEEPVLKEEPVSKKEEKQAEKKPDPLKAPQVIRKIRGEPFPDASGHLKLWCQFFNVLSDSTIKWFKDEEEILEVKRSGGDETQVALAIVLASSQDCGVYGCTINNEYGTDSTDFLLSEDVLADILLRDDLEVGEEIEMTPLLFPKGLVDSGNWGEKYFGRIMTETVQIGGGNAHKTSRVKVIYGLDPVFDSGINCIIKIQNLIPYGTKQESNLAEKNLEITKLECKVQDMIREYCKIFAAEARVNENFGFSLEVIPRYLMYRPANSVPYATVEADLEGDFIQYCTIDPKGKLFTRTGSEVELKCSSFQHWIHQWTHGNLLVTRMEGVETKLTNIGVVTKSKGYQGLTEVGSPDIFEQFQTHHQCNYYCGLLGLRPLKSMESQSTKIKGSRSPLLNRKLGSNSPQTQRKGQSPQTTRKASSSPKVARKVHEMEDNKSVQKVAALEMR